jgi:N-acetylglucosamine kinase-like BadF-type ATPase
VFLGVDGGGTKTAFCLLTRSGDVAATVEAASAYSPGDLGILTQVLQDGVREVCSRAGITRHDVRQAFFGIPAYGESRAAVPLIDAVPRQVLGHDRYSCDNDMVCGWAGSLGLADGINVISGTGSMAYGERAGRRARTGGWGELFGDEGSAYWIAVRGLSAFSRMSDGRQPSGPLHEMVLEHFSAVVDFDVLDVALNQWRGDRGRVAALCPVVVQAADAGDPCAAEIVEDAAAELVGLVDAARRRLEFPAGSDVPVSHSGGVFNAHAVRQAFGRRLAATQGGYRLVPPVYSPVVGAALYAAKQAGLPLNGDALQRLASSARH